VTVPAARGGSRGVAPRTRIDYGDLELVQDLFRAYAGALDPADPRLTLTGADLRGLPPLLVQTGGAERLRDEDIALVERARAAGVGATLELLEDMPHAVALMQAYAPQGRAALESAAAFIQRGLRERDSVLGSSRSPAAMSRESDPKGVSPAGAGRRG